MNILVIIMCLSHKKFIRNRKFKELDNEILWLKYKEVTYFQNKSNLSIQMNYNKIKDLI